MRWFFLRALFGVFVAMALFWLMVDGLLGLTGWTASWHPWLRGVVEVWLTLILGALISTAVGKVFRGRRPDFWVQLNEALIRISRGDFTVQIPTVNQDRNPDNRFQTLVTNLNTMTEALARMEDLRRQFVADVSHEFQSPLTSILGFAQALQTDLPPELRLRYLSIIEAEARRLSRLADALLKLNSLDDRSVPPDPQPFRLDAQLRRILVTLEPQWSAKGLDVEADLEETTVVGSEELWTQVWTNLIHNSVKFTPSGGRVTVRCRPGSPWLVEVEDTGIGLTAEQAGRVFERFYKAESARSEAGGGNGLGLALAKRIVDLHGGALEVESPGLGRGTVFRVRA